MDVQGLVSAGTVSHAQSALRALIPLVTAAFEEASKLVVRIHDQRVNTDRALADEPTRDLLESLALGPTLVKGQFNYEHRRWAEPYAVGDIQAREQMKDVLIALQMTVVIVLRTVYMDEIDVDFNALQTASDDCRVNASVCLGQLSQRLSDQAKVVAMWPQARLKNSYHYGIPAMPPASPDLTDSTSHSTFSSSGNATRTPKDLSDRLNNMSLAPGTPKQAIGLPRTTDPEGASMRRPSSTTLAPDDVEFLSSRAERRPDNGAIVHLPGEDDLDRASYVSLNPNNGTISPVQWLQSPGFQQSSAMQPKQNSGALHGPDDYIPGDGVGEQSAGHSDDLDRSSSHDSASASFSARAIEQNHSTLEHIGYLRQYGRQPSLPYPQTPNLMLQALLRYPDRLPFSPPGPPPTSQARQDSIGMGPSPSPCGVFNPPVDSAHSTYPPSLPSLHPWHDSSAMSGPIPVDPPSTMHQPGMPQRAPTGNISAPPGPSNSEPLYHPTDPVTRPAYSQQQVLSNNTTVALPQRTPSRPSTATSFPTIPLNLPTEKATQGFCKGAVRLFLQNGVSNKAFSTANRPVGLRGMVPYWRCDKCNFEGPVITHVNMSPANKKKKGREEKIFDPKVRVSMGGGVRYKWVFLAKSHCTLKSQVDFMLPAANQGEIGAFQCLFCVAEGYVRGWTTNGGPGTTSGNASIRSSSTGNGSINQRGVSLPVFGNLQMFLEHLDQTHRQEQGWPGVEMLGRMKCVVGRIASGDEDWDVNFVPIRDDEVLSGRQA
ncbi:hypothetical protein DV736_g11, partial [Chaetothyriales sp. CBS 134916]